MDGSYNNHPKPHKIGLTLSGGGAKGIATIAPAAQDNKSKLNVEFDTLYMRCNSGKRATQLA